MIATQYSRSMRVIAKVSVRPGGTGHGPSNWTYIPFAPNQLSSSFLGMDNVRICLNALMRTPCQNSGFYIPELGEIILHQDVLAPVEDLRLPLSLGALYLFVM